MNAHTLRMSWRGLALSIFVCFAQHADAQLLSNAHVEALEGKVAPGTGTLHWTDVGAPTIADDGEIVFRGFLDNTGATQQVGIWHGSGGNYSLLVLTDDPAPGAGTGATFEE